MKIIVNGEERALTKALDITTFLDEAGYGDMLVAVAVNGAFVPRGTYSETMLQNGDSVEIVAPMQGG